jgi:hypothetical protein
MPTKNMDTFWVSNSHGSGYAEFYLLGYNVRVAHWKSTDVSQEHVASIFRVEE